MFSDGVVELVEALQISPTRKKTLHRGKSVATFLMGTRRLYDYVDNNPAVAMYPVQYVNDPLRHRAERQPGLDQLLRPDRHHGPGGVHSPPKPAADLRRGRPDRLRPGANEQGRPGYHGHALHHRRRQRSPRSSPSWTRGSAVTTSRNDVNYVVTEYGIAQPGARTSGRGRGTHRHRPPRLPG